MAAALAPLDLAGSSFVFTAMDAGNSIDVANAGTITSGEFKIVEKDVNGLSADETVSVDSNGNLELLLLKSPTSDQTSLYNIYQHSVSDRKTFENVLFKNKVATKGKDVLGYDLANYVGTKIYPNAYSIDNLIVSNVDNVDKIVLENGANFKIGSEDTKATSLDLTDVYTKGVRRELTTWPTAITDVTFKGKVKFLENVEVANLNDKTASLISVDPGSDFIPIGDKSTSATRVFANKVLKLSS